MSAHALSTSAEASDSMRGARDTVNSAMQSLQQGVSEGLPAVGNFVSRVVYTASYAVSYGFVFPVMLVASVIPKDNALAHGLADGALAVRDRVAAWRSGEADLDADQSHDEEESNAGHNGSASAKSHSRRRTTRHHRGGRRTSH